MDIVIIGAGNVATHIARSLVACGVVPRQIWSRTMESALQLAGECDCQAVSDWDSVVVDADIYVVAVVDNKLESVVAELGHRIRNGVVVHTAGSMSISVFDGHCRRYGVFYPMQTFSKSKKVNFHRIPCFVEASSPEVLLVVKTFAGMLSQYVYEMSSADRQWLHVAAVFSCNFANACYCMADKVLRSHGLDFSVMLPLVEETTKKLSVLRPDEAQTGPAVRGDLNVMERHLRMLGSQSELGRIYSLMSEYISNNIKKRIE